MREGLAHARRAWGMSKAEFWDLTFFDYWMMARDENEANTARMEGYRALAWWSAYAQCGKQLPDWKGFVRRPPSRAEQKRADDVNAAHFQETLRRHRFSPDGKKVVRPPPAKG